MSFLWEFVQIFKVDINIFQYEKKNEIEDIKKRQNIN